MMKEFRLFLYFLIGFLLSVNVELAFSETISATPGQGAVPLYGPRYYANNNSAAGRFDSAEKACSTAYPGRVTIPTGNALTTYPGTSIQALCKNTIGTSQDFITGEMWCPSGTSWSSGACRGTIYTCPSGYTLINTNQCYKPDCPMYGTSSGDSAGAAAPAGCECPSGSKWMPGGGCRKTCDKAAGEAPWGDPALVYPAGSSSSCYAGCVVQPKSDEYHQFPDGRRSYNKSTSEGWACDTAATAPNKPEMPEAPKLPDGKPSKPNPACGEGEGVVTSSSGRVGCVPQGTPENKLPASNTPEVTKRKETITDSNGNETTKEVTRVKDPSTGAFEETTNSKDGNGNSSSSGKGGSGDNAGIPFCAENPDHITCIKGKIGEKGKFDVNPAEVDQARAKLSAEFNMIKAQSSALFKSSGSGAGSLPCPPAVTVLGRSISFCVQDKSDQLTVIGAVVMLAAAIISAMIVFR